MEEAPESEDSTTAVKDEALYMFDYEKIGIIKTDSIEVKIKNCKTMLDMYGDFLIFGEIVNQSDVYKTDIEITFNFFDKKGEEIFSDAIVTYAEHLRPEESCPFSYHVEDKKSYIDISEVKIGVNYKNYNSTFEGNPVVVKENFYYQDDRLVIEGKVINIGRQKIENLKLLGVFYDKRDRLAFIRECYIKRSSLMPGEDEKFTLNILLDRYIGPFTHYDFDVFYNDALEELT